MTVYTMTDKATGEQYEVVPHTIGDNYVDFAPLSNAGTEDWQINSKLTRFENDGAGNLKSNDYTIVIKGEQTQLPAETETAVEADVVEAELEAPVEAPVVETETESTEAVA